MLKITKSHFEVVQKYVYTFFLAVILGFMLQIAHAWVEPTLTPPGANAPAPLNESNVGQEKIGGLLLNSGGAATGLIVDKGRVGVGTSLPEALLSVFGNIQIKDGTQGVGKVLTSDASGVASWQATSALTYVGSCSAISSTEGGNTTCSISGANFMIIQGFWVGGDIGHNVGCFIEGGGFGIYGRAQHDNNYRNSHANCTFYGYRI
ncbi:MAG: hypothetical protein AAB611_03020 [Patescibacteria group bacterium]